MNKPCKFLVTRVMPVIGAALIVLAWAYGRNDSARIQTVNSPEGLRLELWLAQERVLPVDAGYITVDAGFRVYTGEEGTGSLAFVEGLVPVVAMDGSVFWPVTLYEDVATCETVFLNADGAEAGRLPPPPDYDPLWALAAAYPDGVPQGVDIENYDPASVIMTVWLSLPEWRDVLEDAGLGAVREDMETDGVVIVTAPALRHVAAAAAVITSGANLLDNCRSIDGVMTNATTTLPGYNSALPGHTMYVNAHSGNDAWAGELPFAMDGIGPKRTILAGLATSVGGQSLEVGSGLYRESIDIRGRHVCMRITGDVVLGREPIVMHTGTIPSAGMTTPSGFSPTGEVERISISQ